MLSSALQRSVVVSAFRYALGRSSYVVIDTAEALKETASMFPKHQRFQIVNEIDIAIRAGKAGMPMDVKVWREVQVFYRKLDEPVADSNNSPF